METTPSNKRIKLPSSDPSIDNPLAEPNFKRSEPANRQNTPSEQFKRTCEDSNQFQISNSSFSKGTDKDSQEHENLKMNSGNLSTELKTEEGEKSLSRSNYTSRFLVRRELLEGRRRSLCLHSQDSADGSPRKTNFNFSPMKPPKSSLEDVGNASLSSFRQKNDTHITDSSEVPGIIKNAELPSEMNIGDGEPLDVDQVRKAETVRSCEVALQNLEAAAENALLSFRQLETFNIEKEKSKSVEVPLYAKAAKILPSIERKIQAIARILQPSSSSPCEE